MKKVMRNFLLLSLFIVGAASAQIQLNFAGFDTANCLTFKADSFRVSKPFVFSNAENKLLVFIYDDTTQAGRVLDTLVAEVGYQMGAPVYNLLNKLDTVWTNTVALDTINSITASKRYNPEKYGQAASWALYDQFETSIRPHGQIDTTIGTSSSAIFLPINPQWSPYVRFYIKGLTGNSSAAFLKAKWVFLQRKWINTRNQ